MGAAIWLDAGSKLMISPSGIFCARTFRLPDNMNKLSKPLSYIVVWFSLLMFLMLLCLGYFKPEDRAGEGRGGDTQCVA